jgi:hypothetical protein
MNLHWPLKEHSVSFKNLPQFTNHKPNFLFAGPPFSSFPQEADGLLLMARMIN